MSVDTEFDDAIRGGLEHALRDTFQEAKRRSSGPYSSKVLRNEYDHPYATRHGSPGLDPSVINIQTGGFLQAWRDPEIMRFGEDYSARIVNDSDVADFLKNGNGFTVKRPIEEALEKYACEETERRIDQRLRKWAKQAF